MTAAAAHLAPFFHINNMFGQASVDGLTPEMWAERPHAGVNHPVWILAHVNGVRRHIARNLGVEVGGGDVPAPDFGDDCLSADNYPAPTELLEEYLELGAKIATRLETADAQVLGATYQPTFPDDKDRTVGEALTFLAVHESMHIGQLSLIRRLHGLRGIANVAMELMAKAQA